MPESHSSSFEEFDLHVELDDGGSVEVNDCEEGDLVIAMTWDTLREVIEFIGKHGLNISNPWFGEYEETVEGAQIAAE